ncbi:beta-glucosidase BoGH3B [Candidatus Phycosocius bacilliformis]|uniref:Beta-glucosidase BoGH3B n=1 Tax=Candidatus Phycosocius bacilliformis TaxID=1445552 RepID=A0A2P2EA49_9PROT|nr:glycoside hydrolase family 3 protein [Candidatus Phycosocius bacilliformis]GBF57932.1 beta-glucosidase BoGH3B [Candidatus Phycosocius bacilliformis]
MKNRALNPRLGTVVRVGLVGILTACFSLVGCASGPKKDDQVEARITEIISKMSVEQKVAQLIMPDISTITPEDVAKYRFGTILNGGNSGPYGNERAKPEEWLKLADAFWAASRTPHADGSPVIPVLWATDAVHGHNNVVGATIFPHNIGLGATRDPALIREIGRITAAEIKVTGIDWTFAPTLAVVRDDRWGRTYEGYGEDKQLVSDLGAAMVEGLQGVGSEFLSQERVIATAKHFFGDGGTGGVDTGDTVGKEADLVALHAFPYRAALQSGAQTVMASFSSINGQKMHGSKSYLTELLKVEMGFDGLVVGDWNGHGRIPGCTNSDCPESINAGLDIFMVPEDWKALLTNTKAAVDSGKISQARLDDAVRRILRVKMRYGLFDLPAPSARKLGGQFALLGAPEHRAVARKAVSESLVLLKNEGVLPIDPRRTILVAGEGADNIAKQSGGWTITWQGGGDLSNADFPGAQSIFAGIAQQAEAAGGKAILSVDGSYTQKPDVAIVVFGEKPYAEFMGDVKNLSYTDAKPLTLLKKFQAEKIPTVAVFLTGRPLWVNKELNAADAFVAAWLPGSEGGGVADVLLKTKDGQIQKDFKGKLSFSWPQACDTYSLNPGEAGYKPLFEYGFGLNYATKAAWTPLGEACALSKPNADNDVAVFARGQSLAPFALFAADGQGQRIRLASAKGRSADGKVSVVAMDRSAQEDARTISWTAGGAFGFDLAGTLNPAALGQGRALRIEYQVGTRPSGPVTLSMSCGPNCRDEIDITASVALAEQKGWLTAVVPLSCFRKGPQIGLPLSIQSSGRFEMSISSVTLVDDGGETSCRF